MLPPPWPLVHLCCKAAPGIFGIAKAHWLSAGAKIAPIFLRRDACAVASNPPDWPGVICPAFFLYLSPVRVWALSGLTRLTFDFCAVSTQYFANLGSRRTIRDSLDQLGELVPRLAPFHEANRVRDDLAFEIGARSG